MTRIRLVLASRSRCAAAGAAADAAPADVAAAGGDVLYLNLVWHQHQPLYYKDAGVVTRPWVRVHATKDYYDMAAMLRQYPDVHVTFNLTPVLIRQLDELAAGTKDVYQVLGGEAGGDAHRRGQAASSSSGSSTRTGRTSSPGSPGTRSC